MKRQTKAVTVGALVAIGTLNSLLSNETQAELRTDHGNSVKDLLIESLDFDTLRCPEENEAMDLSNFDSVTITVSLSDMEPSPNWCVFG